MHGTDPGEDRWDEADAVRVGLLTRNNWKIRSQGAEGIGTESFLVDGIANHQAMRAVVEALLGGAATPVRRVRGSERPPMRTSPAGPTMPSPHRSFSRTG